MQSAGTYFRDYGEYHKATGNKLTHLIGIPLIILGLLGLLNRISFYNWDIPLINLSPALLVWLLGNGFYVKLHVILGLSMYMSTALLYLAGALMPVSVLWTFFILGWIAQFFGHMVYEKKSPAFLKNLTHLMIGPIFIQNYFLRIYRY